MREHAALRRAGRAGGVDERAEVVLLDVAAGVVERARMRGGVFAAFGLERRQLVEAEELAQRRRLRPYRRELLALRLVLGEREHRLGVGEDVRALACAVFVG